MSKVFVTGLGVVAPGGHGVAPFFQSLLSGTSAVSRITADYGERLSLPYAAQVQLEVNQQFPAPLVRTADRVSLLALLAVAEALTDAGLDAAEASIRDSIGVYLGTAVAGATTLDEGYRDLYLKGAPRLKPFTVLMVMNNAAAATIAQAHGFAGPSLTFSTACSSSAIAIGEAAKRIQTGRSDIILAGGAEAPLTLGQIKAWESLRTLALADPIAPTTSCKPFARDRSGLVLGEGAGIVVLEAEEHARRRGAPIYAEVIGYGTTTDCEHLARPAVAGQVRTMRAALRDAGLDAGSIDYINAHGTGTVQNDAAETAAIKEVFGDRAYRIPISSTKAAHGHLLGAAGALEFIISIQAMRENVVPPTLHLVERDPECDLDYVPMTARSTKVCVSMSNSFAFGGSNAVLIVRKV